MDARPYIVYPRANKSAAGTKTELAINTFVNEPGQVSFGVNDFVPGLFRSLHRHYTWELIIIDSSSAGPGYTFFDGHWWRAEPGSGVFVPKGCPHSWSSGNSKGFKMLWVYGGSREEAGRIWDVRPEDGQPITPEEERNALVWTAEAAGHNPIEKKETR
ncbi:MAG: AraC binding protein [Dehalococcoidales bacterium]|nr:AraC binding protein [Dehalococcoidales bacterium]